MLLLTPSHGFSGGIERVADAVEHTWPSDVMRVDLYRGERTDTAAGQPLVKACFAGRALRSALSHHPSIIFALHIGLLPVAFGAARLIGARTALLGHGVEVWGPLPAWSRALLPRCSHLLAASRFTAVWMSRRAAIAERSINVIPLPVTAQFAQVALGPSCAAARSDGQTLLTVTRLVHEHRYKGYFEIAECLPSVAVDWPGLRWIIVGGGDDLGPLRRRCEELGIAARTELWGHVDDATLMDAYRQADVFVLPSVAETHTHPPRGEGFGLVYAEAAAFGIPSVASAQGGGALDLVEHGVTGLTVPPNDGSALGGALRCLLGDPVERERLGTAARDRLRERHLPQDFAVRLVAALA